MPRELRNFDSDQIEFLETLVDFAERVWPRDLEDARKKRDVDPELIKFIEMNLEHLAQLSAMVKSEMHERGIPFPD